MLARLEGPLHSKRRIHDELVGHCEVMADFPLSTYSEVEVGVHTFHLVKVEPELRFGDEHEVALAVYEATVAPKVSKTASSEQATCEVVVPSSGELPRSRVGLLGSSLELGTTTLLAASSPLAVLLTSGAIAAS